MLLVGTFVIWGVGTGVTDIIGRLLNGDGSVASVAGRKIELPEVQDAYRRQLAQVMRMFGGKMETTPQIRRGVAAQAIEQLVTQTAVSAAVSDLGLAVPDAALRQEVFAMPAFRGANGQFDRATFEQLLRSNGFTEQRFLAVMRQEIGQRQLMEAVRAGVISPDILTREVYAFQQEKRVADMVSLPFAAAPAPPAPTEAQLTRWYDNHKDNYTTPEYRKIKAVVLDPAIVGKDIPVADEDLKAAYGQHTAEYQRPEKRSLQVLLTDDEAKAKEMAAQWVLGEPPAKPVELNDATRVEIPAPELADAAAGRGQDAGRRARGTARPDRRRQGGRPDLRAGRQDRGHAGRRHGAGRPADRSRAGRGHRHLGCEGPDPGGAAGADPGIGRAGQRPRPGGVRPEEGRPAPPGRGAEGRRGRLRRLFRGGRGRGHPAGATALCPGGRFGAGGLDP
jgi:hypothetical protein